MSASTELSRIRLALHGGAGDPGDEAESAESCAALRRIAEDALQLLRAGAPALDAVSLAVERLENCPLFNAGVGAVLNRDGLPELDAAVMRGADRAAGAVACVSRVKNPVRLARAVMERTPHVLFCGSGAERLAESLGLPMVAPDHFITPQRQRQLERARRAGAIALDHDAAREDHGGGFGTVGAVARDADGRLAAATSTGGLTNKLPGRIGDTPLPGAGTFADDASCAISATGTGEAFIKAGFGHAVHARIVFNGQTLAAACIDALADVARYGGRGGCIAIDRDGVLALPFNAKAMYRAWCGSDGVLRVAVRAAEEDA